MEVRTFKFSVDEDGKFTYCPSSNPVKDQEPGDWAYTHRDGVRFESPDGPFTISLRRIDTGGGPDGLQNPFGGDLNAEQDCEGPWVAEVSEIDDGLTDEVRRNRFLAKGFVAKYRYLIGVLKSGTIRIDDTHNGTHTC